VIESTAILKMLRIPNVDSGSAIGAAGPDHAAVTAQLAKILASSHFRQSKRSQALLRCAVEAALAGDLNRLKERQIGVAVFGREAAYDTAQDPVVRNAAIEVRKRLAQFYLEPEHAGDLRIELPLGSYIPAFTVESPALEVRAPEPPRAVAVAAARPSHRLKWVLAAIALLAIVGVAAIRWETRQTPASELEGFWEPLFRDAKSIQICVGQPTRLYRFTGPRLEELNRALGGPPAADRNVPNLSIAPSELSWVAPEYLFLRDALAAFNVASWVQSKGRTYQLMSVTQANYSRMRHEPMVAIGAFNNAWSMRVTSELRFVFDHRTIDGVTYSYIQDRRNPNAMDWKVAQPAATNMTEDFATVTRVFDAATEKTVISAAGIETYGTFAASEFITKPEYLGVALASVPKDQRRNNVQFVLGTKIIDGTAGPPRVLATYFW
jgi:hypothetical protein